MRLALQRSLYSVAFQVLDSFDSCVAGLSPYKHIISVSAGNYLPHSGSICLGLSESYPPFGWKLIPRRKPHQGFPAPQTSPMQLTPAQKQRQRDQIAREKTERLEH